jgi:hypothetical protein
VKGTYDKLYILKQLLYNMQNAHKEKLSKCRVRVSSAEDRGGLNQSSAGGEGEKTEPR